MSDNFSITDISIIVKHNLLTMSDKMLDTGKLICYTEFILTGGSMPMIHLRDYVLQKQAEWGREILIKDIVESTGISRDTVSRLWNGKARNANEDTLFALCKYFGIPKGQPIPFIVYDPD